MANSRGEQPWRTAVANSGGDSGCDSGGGGVGNGVGVCKVWLRVAKGRTVGGEAWAGGVIVIDAHTEEPWGYNLARFWLRTSLNVNSTCCSVSISQLKQKHNFIKNVNSFGWPSCPPASNHQAVDK